ncbi:S24 family peptidase [Noviherbaspirillum humi]|nr:LexA family transcriptional regulator [Noviherbaspirillum humi]
MKRRELTEEEKQEAERLNAAWLGYKAANKGATQTWLAAASGLGTQGAVGQYLRGVIPLNLEALFSICRVIGASPHEISPRLAETVTEVLAPSNLHRLSSQEQVNSASISKAQRIHALEDGEEHPDAILIRRVKLTVSAGIVGFSFDLVEEDDNPIFFRRQWFLKRGYDPEKLLAIRVKGESMEPRLYEGDTVVVNTADTKPKDGEIFVINYEGEAVVKRLVRELGAWWLVSDNQDQRKYPRKRCEDDGCLIIGRMVLSQTERS